MLTGIRTVLTQISTAFLSSFKDLLPIIVVITFFQVLVLQKPIPNLFEILSGLLLVVIGLSLFIKGLEIGLFPISENMAYAFAKKGSS